MDTVPMACNARICSVAAPFHQCLTHALPGLDQRACAGVKAQSRERGRTKKKKASATETAVAQCTRAFAPPLLTVWRNSHFRTKKTQAAVQRLLWLRTGPMSPCAQSKWLRNSRYMSMTDSDGYLAISRNHTLTRPAQLFFFGVCAPGRFSWLQSLGRTQVAPRGGADGAGTPARTATSTSTCQTCLWDGL